MPPQKDLCNPNFFQEKYARFSGSKNTFNSFRSCYQIQFFTVRLNLHFKPEFTSRETFQQVIKLNGFLLNSLNSVNLD